MGEWIHKSLDQLYEFSSGLSKPRSAFGSGYPFLSFKDVFYNTAVPPVLSELVNSTADERQRCSVLRGDVLLTRTSETMNELGMSCVALRDVPDATFNGFSKRLRPRDASAVVPEFARYFFRSSQFRNSLGGMSSMSTRASLNNEMLSRVSMLVPPPEEQAAIGEVLCSLDDKIELNRRMAQTLEEMARALFKSWFVDFDPVRAKAEGRDTGLPSHIADLFPDCLVDSALSEIPAGWTVSTVGKVVDVVGGSTPTTTELDYWSGGTNHWATPKDLSKLEFPVLLSTERCVTDEGLAKISSGLLPIGTVLMSSRAPIGYLAIAEVPTAVNQGFMAMLPRSSRTRHFLLRWAESSLPAIVGRANGSTFLEISKAGFRPIELVMPTDTVLSEFDSRATILHQRLVALLREVTRLEAQRDVLLPRLVSGQLRIGHPDDLLAKIEAFS